MTNELIVPGEKLGIEEEFAAGENTYVKNGILYSLVTGVKTSKDGTLSVKSLGREVKIIDKGMTVLGSVVGDMKSVIFVKIDNINTANKEYVAIKDGKIVMPKPHDSRGHFDRHGPHDRRPERGGGGFEKPQRPCGIGDIIIADVQYNDKDSYALSLNSVNSGVVYAKCGACGSDMALGRDNSLRCVKCERVEFKKVSPLYNKPEEIRKIFG
jgi:exosome complex component CSL4